MQLNPIETEADHEAALREIERLWGAEESTAEGHRLDELTSLVEVYEEARFPWPTHPNSRDK
jgi:HTH-type transcriptional regulator/antitoxin HigA